MKYYYIEEEKWITAEELQKRLNEGFDFKCNECHKKIGNHVKVLPEGIFCVGCFNKIIEGQILCI